MNTHRLNEQVHTAAASVQSSVSSVSGLCSRSMLVNFCVYVGVYISAQVFVRADVQK